MPLISAALLGLMLVSNPQVDARQAAERLARSGSHAEALQQFQAIAAANPDDVEARLWIARLHTWMGRHERGLDVYRSIVATNPQNVDALLGAGHTLTTLGRIDEAADALARAEALAADRPAVLAAQGRMHAAAGRTTLALAYYERALALQPGDQEVRAGYDALRAGRAHRIEAGYMFERFDVGSGDAEAHWVSVEANGRVTDAVRLFGIGQYRGFGDSDENRGGGGVEWSITPAVSLRAGALFGGDPESLPESDVFFEGEVVRGRARFGFDLRFADFGGPDLWIGGPRVTVALNDRVDLLVGYHWSRAELFEADSHNGFTARVTGRLTPRVRARAAYRRGIDRLDWLALDRLVAGEANTASFGLSYDVTPFVTLHGDYDHQDRDQVTVNRALAHLTFRF